LKHSTQISAFALFLAIAFSAAAIASDGIETRQVHFAKGATSATVKGSIHGRQAVDYKLRARGGQTMTVTLDSKHSGLAFNVLPPGSQNVAIPDSIAQQRWTGTLPADGEYTVRTYLDRASGRRGEKASYTLTVAIDAGAPRATSSVGSGTSGESSSLRAGQGRFDATGKIPCAQAKGQPMGQCDFGVAREGGGTATVAVTRPDGRKRFLSFDKGKAVGADLSQADGNMTFRATKESDLYRIQAGDERYEIPEAVIFGG